MTKWHGCYDDGWKGNITPESFCHPAKMARGLLERIVTHGLERGWWKAGDRIGDPFSGVGSTGIVGAYHGLRVIGCELEPRFHALALENRELHRRKWEALGCPLPEYICGDSRNFAALVGAIDGAVMSPPYIEGLGHGGSGTERDHAKGLHAACNARGYGGGDGNIANLRAGDIAAVITSPPYADSVNAEGNAIDWEKAGRADRTKPSADRQNPMSTGAMKYGSTPGQIGALKGIVTSPPWEQNGANLGDVGNTNAMRQEISAQSVKRDDAYGQSEGQLGNSTGETYWSAMRLVYDQCRLALTPGGYMAVVIKDYVKNRARVPLCDQTLELLTALGFAAVERIHAMLVKESTRQGLFGAETKRKERKSFFRRLAESKGSPRIDYEEVLVVRKPA